MRVRLKHLGGDPAFMVTVMEESPTFYIVHRVEQGPNGPAHLYDTLPKAAYEPVPEERWEDVTDGCEWCPDTERLWGRIEHRGENVLANPSDYRLVKVSRREEMVEPAPPRHPGEWVCKITRSYFRVERRVTA